MGGPMGPPLPRPVAQPVKSGRLGRIRRNSDAD